MYKNFVCISPHKMCWSFCHYNETVRLGPEHFGHVHTQRMLLIKYGLIVRCVTLVFHLNGNINIYRRRTPKLPLSREGSLSCHILVVTCQFFLWHTKDRTSCCFQSNLNNFTTNIAIFGGKGVAWVTYVICLTYVFPRSSPMFNILSEHILNAWFFSSICWTIGLWISINQVFNTYIPPLYNTCNTYYNYMNIEGVYIITYLPVLKTLLIEIQRPVVWLNIYSYIWITIKYLKNCSLQ